MARDPRILAFAGSTRRGSLNKQLLAVAVRGAERSGVQVTTIDLASFPLPLYDGDLEGELGEPVEVARLKTELLTHEGWLIATPEHNGSFPALLKNTVDWVSRPDRAVFQGKYCALLSASSTAGGGLRSLGATGALLGNVGAFVLPGMLGVAHADRTLGPTGLLDSVLEQKIEAIGAGLALLLRRLAD